MAGEREARKLCCARGWGPITLCFSWIGAIFGDVSFLLALMASFGVRKARVHHSTAQAVFELNFFAKSLCHCLLGPCIHHSFCGDVDVGVDLVGASVCGERKWDLFNLSHLCFMGDDVHFHFPSDGNHFLSRGWLLSSNASLVILGLHLGKGLLSKEDGNVFAEHQGQVTLGDEMSIQERDRQIVETSCQIQQSFAIKGSQIAKVV